MHVRMLAVAAATFAGLGLGQPAGAGAGAGGWDEGAAASGAIPGPTGVYVPAARRSKGCVRGFHPRCRAHSFVVYRYEGDAYPRYHYRWRGYGWNR